MISRFGKHIPFIFLFIGVFIFFDSLVSIQELHNIHNDQSQIRITYETPHIAHPKNFEQLIASKISAFNTTVMLMYIIIIISGILNMLLLVIAYVAIERELKQRTFLEQKKNEFISLASHELKTPITTLRIFSEFFSKRLAGKKDKKTNHILKQMLGQIDEMNKLIDDLLDVTRIQLGRLELDRKKVTLNSLIQETIEEIQTTTKKHKIIFKKSSKIYVFADRQRVWQVLSNILNNAIKYSPYGGDIKVQAITKGKNAIISVNDHGIGIQRSNLNLIFDRYFREKGTSEKQFSGLGLGLYISSQILSLHGGNIWAKSKRGKGATFFFSLPLFREEKNKQII